MENLLICLMGRHFIYLVSSKLGFTNRKKPLIKPLIRTKKPKDIEMRSAVLASTDIKLRRDNRLNSLNPHPPIVIGIAAANNARGVIKRQSRIDKPASRSTAIIQTTRLDVKTI